MQHEPDPLPEISPDQLAEWLASKPGMILLDVREIFEVEYTRLNDPRVVYAPLSQLAMNGENALPDEVRDPRVELVVFCHLGQRSAQVTAWLKSTGYAQIFNLRGGLDAYAMMIDPSIRRY